RHARSCLLPYTTLFRSRAAGVEGAELERVQDHVLVAALATVAGLDAVADHPRHEFLLLRPLRLRVDAAGQPEHVLTHGRGVEGRDRKSTRLNSSHVKIS